MQGIHAFQRSRLLVTLGFCLLLPKVHADEPGIDFDGTDVVATAVAPGAEMVWLGGGQFLDRNVPTEIYGVEHGFDDDADGVVRWSLGRDVPGLSVWLAAEVASGAVAVDAPGQAVRQVDAPGLRVTQGVARRWERLEVDAGRVQLLLVRPGKGAWATEAVEGGPLDEDGVADGRLSLDADRWQPLASNADTLAELREGDVLALFDPSRVTLAVHTLAAKDFGADDVGGEE